MKSGAGWPIVPLGSLASSRKGAMAGGPFGSDLVSRDYVESGVPVVRGVNLPLTSRFSCDNFVYVSPAKADRLHLNCAKPGDLVFTQRGTLGQVGVLPQGTAYKKFLISQSQMKMTVDETKACPSFIYYYFRSRDTVSYVESIALQAGVPHINLGILRKFPIVAPPAVIQQKVAAVLSAYDDLIENNRRRIVLLERTAEQLYREWFVRFRFPGYEQAKLERGVPIDWKKGRFSDLCTLQRGFDLPDSQIAGGDYPVIASTSIKAFHSSFKVRPPVITTGRSGSLGKVLWTDKKSWPLNTTLFVKSFLGNSPFFIFYTLKAMRLESFNCGAGVPMLNRNHLNNLPVNIPPAELQSAFAVQLAPIHALMSSLAIACDELSKNRDLLLPRLISGKLRVDELDIQFPPSMQTERA
jgi:type I restriction enzyme S subunit